MYDFPENASQSTIDFVGKNRFSHEKMLNKIGSYTEGMLSKYFPPNDELRNQYICPYYGFPNPFFEKPMNGTINNQIYTNLKAVNNMNFSQIFDYYTIPDGAVFFENANTTNLDIRLQINDVRMTQYHRYYI